MAPLKLNIDLQNAAVASLLVIENFKSTSKFSCDIEYKNVSSIEIDRYGYSLY
uniref:Uncharacterized protein n=1 Tax=Octopus bimaculoides TaxID=37653 RepID=A0A0L8FRL2_OCTBM